ncbi:MAG: hypothetical protein PHU33_00035 [Bacteroidales bacterium]|nr:hypothetical protein [Bacteroidales bacterium]
MKRTIYSLLFFALVATSLTSAAQSESAFKFNAGADIMSRYIWRGLDYGASPSIQPTLSISGAGFELGYWGAISTLGTYSEVDLYAKYSIGGFSIMATDYFFPKDVVPVAKSDKYFNWEKETTGHLVEGAVQYKNPEVMPFSLLAGVFVYGAADLKADGNQNYSSYFEVTYSGNLAGNDFDIFVGGTADAGLYGTSAGVVNTGITVFRGIKLTDDFTLPVKASVITNPQASNIHFVLGITL